MAAKKYHIEILTTRINNLWRHGFGPIADAERMRDILKRRFSNVSLTVIKKESDLNRVVQSRPDLVISGLNYVIFGKKDNEQSRVWISDLMEKSGINYAGSRRMSLETVLDKGATKEILHEKGVPTAPGFTAESGQYRSSDDIPLEFPLFIKPLHEGDGRGIDRDSIVSDYKSFTRKVESIERDWAQPALAEKYLTGREFTAARLGCTEEGDPLVMSIELLPGEDEKGHRILGFTEKKEDQEETRKIPESEVLHVVASVARKAFRALGNRDYGRIDIRMDESGNPFVIDANFIPGMTGGFSYFPRACRISMGWKFEDVVIRIAEAAIRRKEIPAGACRT